MSTVLWFLAIWCAVSVIGTILLGARMMANHREPIEDDELEQFSHEWERRS